MMLIDAARALEQYAATYPFKLRIAGSGPLETAMRRRVDKEQLGDVVEFVGWRDAEGLRALLRESDGFLAPAVREAFGLAALEARAVGLPVVAMRDSAIADFIGDGESGLLATSESDFSACVRRLVQDTSLRNTIAAHNRSVRPDLTWDRSMSAHAAVYARAMELAKSL